ncbi:hypothetical protein GCM10027160_46080 [Streptomyces calidiresistens]|uniref:Uncharacterized protein n=1 Tax=Streptomyces calidiresistens TaxID=1485586 RepID=A0A7W3XVT3_9ACTN|nr:hypothetical protein [Streptomyces calidiresistens]MBB0229027.1 hypothetical protein [Streptomyces calidiresistens]
MSLLTTVAALRAAETGTAQPLTTVRHAHIDDHPVVLIPLTLAGEACAPLAAMVGTDRDRPVLLTVPQPRDRTLRFRFAEELADILLPLIDGCRTESETYEAGRPKEERTRWTRAPQILVPNPGGIEFIRLLGRSTRLRRTDGPHAVAPTVPLLGNWLTWFADRTDFPGSGLLLAMTRLLTDHWATGWSPGENAHLPSLLAWIDPPPGRTGAEAALLAEDPAEHPPAGPTTDPVFDRTLHELTAARDAAPDDRARAAVDRTIADELRSQLAPTWELMWRGIDLLRALPPAARVPGRRAVDRTVFTHYTTYLEEDGRPRARRDHAASAARRLAQLEDAVARYESERAFDDPLVMARYELTGEAFTGTVVDRDPDRMVENGRAGLFRPALTVRVDTRPLLAVGTTVRCAGRDGLKAEILDRREAAGAGWEIDLQLTGGLGRVRKPPAPEGVIPDLGEELCWTTLGGYMTPAPLPAEEDTPWTHGGPPQPYEPTPDDAEESWE